MPENFANPRPPTPPNPQDLLAIKVGHGRQSNLSTTGLPSEHSVRTVKHRGTGAASDEGYLASTRPFAFVSVLRTESSKATGRFTSKPVLWTAMLSMAILRICLTFALPLAPVKCHDSLPIIVNVTREVEGSLLSVDFEDEHAYHPIKIDGKMIVRQYDATHWTLPGLLDNSRLTNFSKHYKICNTCTIWYRAHLKAQDRAEIPFVFLFVFLVIVKASQEVEKEYSESSTAIANTGKSADSIPDSDQTPTATRNKQPALPAGKSVCRQALGFRLFSTQLRAN